LVHEIFRFDLAVTKFSAVTIRFNLISSKFFLNSPLLPSNCQADQPLHISDRLNCRGIHKNGDAKMLRHYFAALVLLSASAPAWSAGDREDYDINKNGLIEIYDLEDLNEIRNDLTGRTLYGHSAGCPDEGCFGVELMADLDFDTNGDGVIDAGDTYWNDGKGWEPIGPSREDPFRSFFEGNGYVVRNFYLNRSRESYLGLFGYTTDAVIRRIGITGSLTYVRGGSFAGILAGMIFRTKIEAVFTTGYITGSDYLTGGIVGYMREDQSSMSTLFSTATVIDNETTSPHWKPAGGLLGTQTGGEIRNSFSMIPLVRDTATSGTFYSYEVSEGGPPHRRLTLAELTCPTSARDPACRAGLFEAWEKSTDTDGTPFWDFGNRLQLPGLVLNGRLFRDSDGDGLLDDEDDDLDGDGVDNTIDAFPDNPAAAIDDNGNGLPDAWNPECDLSCQQASELVLDELDSDSGTSAGAVNWLFLFFMGLLVVRYLPKN
jgi:hypothetical protein